jgi:hypothetical protein
LTAEEQDRFSPTIINKIEGCQWRLAQDWGQLMGARPVLTEVAERQQKSVTGKLEQKTALGRNSSRGKTRGDFRTDGRQALQPSTNREITAPKAEPEAHLSSQGKGLALTQRQDLDEENWPCHAGEIRPAGWVRRRNKSGSRRPTLEADARLPKQITEVKTKKTGGALAHLALETNEREHCASLRRRELDPKTRHGESPPFCSREWSPSRKILGAKSRRRERNQRTGDRNWDVETPRRQEEYWQRESGNGKSTNEIQLWTSRENQKLAGETKDNSQIYYTQRGENKRHNKIRKMIFFIAINYIYN